MESSLLGGRVAREDGHRQGRVEIGSVGSWLIVCHSVKI